MEFNNYKNEESPDVKEFVRSFQEPDIDIKIETPYFEVYEKCFQDEKIKVPEVEGFHVVNQESNIECNNKNPDVEKCGVSIQVEDNVKKERSDTEELAGSIEEEYMDFENERFDDVKKMTMHECCNGGLLVLVPLPNTSQHFL